MKLTSSGLTHVGMKRSHNEDCLRIFREEGLFVVADGMGGHSSGEVASELSAETLARFYAHTALDEEITWPGKEDYSTTYQENRIRVGVQLSNRKIHEAAVYDVKLKGMGTTLVAAAFYEDKYSVGHVGDSRVYHFRAGALRQVTEDHSLLNDYIKMRPGGMTPEEIKAFPHKNVIVRALGMKDSVVVDVITEQAAAGDLLLLCSDGLSGLITDEEMQALIEEAVEKGGGSTLTANLDALCVSLINAANRNGGNDNITVLIVRCDELGGEGVESAPPKMQTPKGAPLWSRPAEPAPAAAPSALQGHNPTPPTPAPEVAGASSPSSPSAPARPRLQPLSRRLAEQEAARSAEPPSEAAAPAPAQDLSPAHEPQGALEELARGALNMAVDAAGERAKGDYPETMQGLPNALLMSALEAGARALPALAALGGAEGDEGGEPTLNMSELDRLSPPSSSSGETVDMTVDMSADSEETMDLDASLSDGVEPDEFEVDDQTSADADAGDEEGQGS